MQSMMRDLVENRQSSAETVRYLRAPHIKEYIVEQMKREEDSRRQAAEKKEANKKEKKDSAGVNSAKAKSPSRDKSPKSMNKKHPDTIREDAEVNIEQEKSVQLVISEEANTESNVASLARSISVANSNMICFGLPDIYLTN